METALLNISCDKSNLVTATFMSGFHLITCLKHNIYCTFFRETCVAYMSEIYHPQNRGSAMLDVAII